MARADAFAGPFLLGFEDSEHAIKRVAKGSDGYPHYNIERITPHSDGGAFVRITLAVAGFSVEQLDIALKGRELSIRGRQPDEPDRVYLHRGIAARQFQKVFVLADGMDVRGASLDQGLLTIDLAQPEPTRQVRTISISVSGRAEGEAV